MSRPVAILGVAALCWVAGELSSSWTGFLWAAGSLALVGWAVSAAWPRRRRP